MLVMTKLVPGVRALTYTFATLVNVPPWTVRNTTELAVIFDVLTVPVPLDNIFVPIIGLVVVEIYTLFNTVIVENVCGFVKVPTLSYIAVVVEVESLYLIM
jgi:hypothetical protein